MPAAAGETEIARANGLMESVRALGFSAGPLLGGVLGAAGQLRLALVIDALSFATVGARRVRAAGAPATGRRAGGARVRARDGFVVPRCATAPSRSRSAARSPR